MDTSDSTEAPKSGEKRRKNAKKHEVESDIQTNMHTEVVVDSPYDARQSSESNEIASVKLEQIVWNKYSKHLSEKFRRMQKHRKFVDVTLICQRKKIYAHKFLLAACSPFFRQTFRVNESKHPVVLFNDVCYEDLVASIALIYDGEVKIPSIRCDLFWKLIEMLSIPVEKTNESTAKPLGSNVNEMIRGLKLIDEPPVVRPVERNAKHEVVAVTGAKNARFREKDAVSGAKGPEKILNQPSSSQNSLRNSNKSPEETISVIPGPCAGASKTREPKSSSSSDDLEEEDNFSIDEEEVVDTDEDYSSDDEDEGVEDEEEGEEGDGEFLINMKNETLENVCQLAEIEAKKIEQTTCKSSSSSECDKFFLILVQNLDNLNDSNVTETFSVISVLKIFTLERTITTIDMIFQKFLNRPNACKSAACFAKLCHSFAVENDRFKAILLIKCENLFANEILRKQLLLQCDYIIENAKENALDRQMCDLQELEIYLSNERSKAITLFIGNLYIERTLPIQRLMEFIDALAEQQSFEKLEYLCDLLNEVGRFIEFDKNQPTELVISSLNKYYGMLKTIVDNPKNQIEVTLREKIEALNKMRTSKWTCSQDCGQIFTNGRKSVAPKCMSEFNTLHNDLFWIRNNKTSSNIDINFVPMLNVRTPSTSNTRTKSLAMNGELKPFDKLEIKRKVNQGVLRKSNKQVDTSKKLEKPSSSIPTAVKHEMKKREI